MTWKMNPLACPSRMNESYRSFPRTRHSIKLRLYSRHFSHRKPLSPNPFLLSPSFLLKAGNLSYVFQVDLKPELFSSPSAHYSPKAGTENVCNGSSSTSGGERETNRRENCRERRLPLCMALKREKKLFVSSETSPPIESDLINFDWWRRKIRNSLISLTCHVLGANINDSPRMFMCWYLFRPQVMEIHQFHLRERHPPPWEN